MKMSEQFGSSKWLSAPDLQKRSHVLTIQQVVIAEFEEDGGGVGHKPAVYFRGAEKALLLNQTNNQSITEMYGDESDGWIGKPIELFIARVQFRKGMVDAIRIRPPAGTTPASVGVQPIPPAPPVMPAPATPLADPAAQAPIGQEYAPTVPVEENSDIPF